MATTPVHIRIFGLLRPVANELGLPLEFDVAVPPEGIEARDLADQLQIPAEKIEGVFVNHVVHGLSEVVYPGDRVAFVPHGTPGPHRFFLGLYRAGSEEREA